MRLQWSQRPHSISVAKMLHGGRKLYGTEALSLVLGYLRSSWDHHYMLLGSRVKYLKDIFYIDECSGHVCIVTRPIRTRSTILRGPHMKFGFILSSTFRKYVLNRSTDDTGQSHKFTISSPMSLCLKCLWFKRAKTQPENDGTDC